MLGSVGSAGSAPTLLEQAVRASLRCRAQGGRPQLQPTGRTRQRRAEGMAGAAEEKPTKGEAPLPPPPTLWSSNSLILNLRLPPPPHPILTTQTHTHTHTVHAVTLAPFLSSPSHEWPDRDKTQQQPSQEVQPLGVSTEAHFV